MAMTAPANPNWNLLPHDPAGFFGLGEGFERRDLKRRYNQLIRQFKPEKHPAEFQKIRAAYEALDASLRYGGMVSDPPSTQSPYEWVTDESPQPISEDGWGHAVSSSPSPLPLHQRIRNEPVKGLYQELSNKKRKTAFDYYALAVMSDLVESSEKLKFPTWILKGLAAHRYDTGLLQLLHCYVHGSIPDGAAKKLLIACSQTVPEHAFFQITEPLWRNLLQADDFSVFQETMSRCEANLPGLSIDGKLIFTIFILKHALWKADAEWADQQFAFIEENFERIPPFLEYDMELLFALRSYLATRTTFVGGDSFRQKMDTAVHAYFTADSALGDRQVLECQTVMMQDFQVADGAFPNLGDSTYDPFFNLWSWISYDVAERHCEPREMDEHLWLARVPTLIEKVKAHSDGSRLGYWWQVMSLLQVVLAGFLYLLFAVTVTVVFTAISLTIWPKLHEGVLTVLAITLIVLSALLTRRLNRWIAEKYWNQFHLRISESIYRRYWRDEALGFLSRSHIPFHVLTSLTANVLESDNSGLSHFSSYLQQDFALAIYATSLRFAV